jgi:hypothetical protein
VCPQTAPLFATALDERCKVSPFTVLHYNVDGGVLALYDAVVVSHNARVPEFPQDVDFGNKHLLLSVVHLPVVKFLPYKDL